MVQRLRWTTPALDLGPKNVLRVEQHQTTGGCMVSDDADTHKQYQRLCYSVVPVLCLNERLLLLLQKQEWWYLSFSKSNERAVALLALLFFPAVAVHPKVPASQPPAPQNY